MAKKKFLIFGISFFILSFLVIRFYEPKPPLLSITQSSAGKYPYLYEGFVKGTIAVQEITLAKDYLNGVGIRFATKGKVNTSTNTILVLDSNYNVLHHENFSSEGIEDAKYHSFQFNESRKTGRGNKVYICLFSRDGTTDNSLHALFNPSKKIGGLYASNVVNDDIIRSVPNKARIYPGSMMLRTYESDSSLTTAIKRGCYLVAALLALLVIFLKKFQSFLVRLKLRPETVYVIIALIFGPLFVFLNPPFQVPDEGAHVSRAYELSDLHFSNTGKTIPASILKLDSVFSKLPFNPDERTSKNEILSMAKVKLEPAVRKASSGPDYILPYLPQASGISIGRMLGAVPLALLYLGRFFNLIISMLIIFLAIRITPFSKWIFLLLALMPKTLYLMASFSYDAFIISSSFLLIALYLYYAFKADKVLGWKDIGLLFFLSMLLALCKPPYFMIGLLFLIIPVRKIGSRLKYVLVFSVFVVSMLLAQGMWSLVAGLLKSAEIAKTEQAAALKPNTGETITPPGVTQPAATGTTNHSGAAETATAGTIGAAKDNQAGAQPQKPRKPEINPGKQINYIRAHLPKFAGLLFLTNVDHMRSDMLDNFVGTMGWLDTFLPNTLVVLYLIMLLVAALCIAEKDVRVTWIRKLFFFILFITGVLAIETAMYVYSSFVAQERLFGIQGRYFIPLAPLFLLIFYNNAIAEKLDYIFSPRRKSYLNAKSNLKPKILLEIRRERIFAKFLQVFIIGFTVAALTRGVAAILLRYYQW